MCVFTSTANLFLKYKGSQIIVHFGVNVESLTFRTPHYNIVEHCFFSNVAFLHKASIASIIVCKCSVGELQKKVDQSSKLHLITMPLPF